MCESLVTAMWPILGTMRLFGWFPVRRARNKLELSRVWCFFSVLIICLQLIPASILVYRGFQLTPLQEPSVHLLGYIVVLIIFMSQVLAISSALRAVPHVKLYWSFTRFQKSLRKASKGHACLTFEEVQRWSRITPILCLPPFIFMLVVRPLMVGIVPTFEVDIFFALFTCYNIVLLAWWRGIMYALAVCSRELLEQYKSAISRPLLVRDLPFAQHRVLAYRDLWLHLCELLRHGANALDLSFAAVLIISVTCLTYLMYMLLACPDLSIALYLATYVLLFLWDLDILCHGAHCAAKQIQTDIMEATTLTENLAFSHDVQSQLHRFFFHLNRQSLDVSLKGCISVGRNLMTKLFAALISNLIILEQFNIIEKKFDASGFYEFAEFITYSGA